MAARTLLVDFKGLVTAPGLLMRAEASMTQADNCIIDAPGVLRKRPGFQRLSSGYGGPVYQLHTSPLLSDRFIAHYGNATNPSALRIGTGLAASSAITTIDASNVTRAATVRQRIALLGQSHYLTSDEGVRRVESGLTSARFAGMPRGEAPDTANMNAATYAVLQAANPWLVVNAAAAYRVTWHRKDDAGLELGGPPTARLTIRNINGTSGYTGGTLAVRLRVPLPVEYGTANTALTTAYFFRLWRSRSATTGDPDDEMYLVEEKGLVAGDIAAGYVQVDDVTPDSILVGGPRLHTNAVAFPPGEAGIRNGTLNADEAPPSANDVVAWRECLWYADTSGKAALVWQLRVVGGTGLVAGDTVSLDGVVTLTGVAGAPAANQFTVVAGLATLALNVEATARNICEAHNAAAGTNSWAYYISVGNQQAGYIFVEGRQQASGLTPATSRAAAWARIPASTRSGGANRLSFSKPNRADAVPPINELAVGPQMATILRIVPYQERLFVFTTEGVFQVTGSSWADFAVSPFDTTYRLLGRDLVATCDDKVYAWCWEGIVELDNAGVRVVSAPIEPTLVELLGATPATYADYGFAVAYRMAHRVLFFTAASLGQSSGAFVFDTRTRAWTKLKLAKAGATGDQMKSCGIARYSDDRLVLGNWNATGADAYVYAERRGLAAADYTDEDAGGATVAVSLAATLQFMVPDSEGACHWQQTMVHLDGGEFSWRTLPTSFDLNYQTELGSASVTVTPTSGAPLARVEPPTAVRRSNRLSLQLTHATNAEAFGVVGLSQSVSVDGTRLARRT